ncbi:phosphatase PAP2/dual specificity phosphatase family protein [Vibrio sp. S4M6]|uniref:phosphatase PAP2/dual specificity phosphatase family protein n=1 Tax=Vibrio sinus TaxID=2946865 RepID=UPI00202A2EEE|nr:phosphatase PAP2/dual specificity phosphatase family protein [Vibrio sinus]MCL9782972.1 phosphatase PAP2/dual specificity phosphatase family protein [Vibrio sinus]
MAESLTSTRSPAILWGRGVAWLLLLVPLFFTSYSLANAYAASLPQVASVVFAWERHIPLVPWTIVPYWSIDLLYGLAFLLPRTPQQINTLGLRLLTAQLICIGCFFLWPLKFAVERPELHGVFGQMFDVLMGFDKPYNQAPSLHITLLVVLWACCSKYITGPLKWAIHFWFLLIGVSVLTTWQHHFIDVPTGLLAGFFCLWCWPEKGVSPLRARKYNPYPAQFRLASYYGFAGILFAVAANYWSGAALILIWPSVSLLLVGLNYAWIGGLGWQKQPHGRLSLPAFIVFAPYLLGAWINSKLWTLGQSPANEIIPGVWLGRRPSGKQSATYAGLVDMCPELPVFVGDNTHYRHFATLDLLPLSAQQCWQAAKAIQSIRDKQCQPILVYCALGYSRSSVALMAWLLLSQYVRTPEQAKALIEKKRPQVVIRQHHLMALKNMMRLTEFIDYQRDNPAFSGQEHGEVSPSIEVSE